jgi:hypothetical protein
LWLATWILGPIWRIRARRGPDQQQAENLTITLASGTCMTLQMTGATSKTGTDHMDFVGEYATERLLLDGSGPGPLTERAHGLIDLCDSICAGRSHRFTLDHAVHQVEILEALHASLATDREVTVRSPAVLGSWQ